MTRKTIEGWVTKKEKCSAYFMLFYSSKVFEFQLFRKERMMKVISILGSPRKNGAGARIAAGFMDVARTSRERKPKRIT